MAKFSFLKVVAQGLRPDTEVLSRCLIVVGKINKEIKRKKIPAVAVLGGSIAKGTFLRGDYDCDVFVKFNSSCKNKDLSQILGRILEPFVPFRVHGSRDYFQFASEDINFEVVPVLDIKNHKEAVNVTDVSPLHVAWITRAIRKKPALADEIRLTRAFCKSLYVYGAESYINGFSGHVLDILAIYYGGFLQFMRHASKWKDKTIIDPECHYRRKNVLMELNKSKTEGPLVLIDPVQPNRNAAASFSVENFRKFTAAAQLFLKKPSASFFEKKEVTVQELQARAKKSNLTALFMRATPLHAKTDIAGTKLLKAFLYIAKSVKEADFKLADAGWMWDRKSNALFYFFFRKEKPSLYKVHVGPPEQMEAHAQAFKKIYRNTFVENGRLCTRIRRTFTEPKKMLHQLKNESYVRERVKNITVL